ncbi:MAG: hypothetical protein QXR88_02315 [Candidatus Pacearchaeota archaeon]
MNIPTTSLVQLPEDFLANVWAVTGSTFLGIAPLVVIAVSVGLALILGKYAKNLIVGRRRGIR